MKLIEFIWDLLCLFVVVIAMIGFAIVIWIIMDIAKNPEKPKPYRKACMLIEETNWNTAVKRSKPC